jgi:hypothetical protein
MIVAKRVIASGRVVLGPKKIKGGYARIVSQSDGSGRIETFDAGSRSWHVPEEEISFATVWAAPVVSALLVEQLTATSNGV